MLHLGGLARLYPILGIVNHYHKKVIVMWTYRCYDDGQRTNLWKEWYDGHSDYQGSHDSIFNTLEQQQQWGMPHTKVLHVGKETIVEVRIKGDVQHRILGFYSPTKRGEFVVLATCNHKERVYDPPDILQTAVKRKKDIIANKAKANPCARPV